METTKPEKRIEICVVGVKEKFTEWCKTRGGVAVWQNVNLSNPGAGDQYTPATTPEGKPAQEAPPHWSVRFKEVITDISRFKFVKEMKEVKRFRVAIRPSGPFGMTFKCTDASTAKIRKMCAKFSTEDNAACYHFDYETQEAVITVPVWED